MGYHTSACLWLTKPQNPKSVFSCLMDVFADLDVRFCNDEQMLFSDLPNGEERASESPRDRSADECFQVLADWPNLGGLGFRHPAIRLPLSVWFWSSRPHELEYVCVSVLYSNTSGELDQEILFSLARSLFERIDEFGFLFGECPSHRKFSPDSNENFLAALEKIHEIQMKKERAESGFHECIIHTRSLPNR